MNYVAGVLLIALGIWQYFDGHSHGHDHSHEDDHDSQDHNHDTAYTDGIESEPDGWVGRFRGRLMGDTGHPHDHSDDETDCGLYGMALLAFAIGFAHNEEFDIIVICTGSRYCLELMLLYSLAVLVSLVGVTLLLVAGYQRYEQRVEESQTSSRRSPQPS